MIRSVFDAQWERFTEAGNVAKDSFIYITGGFGGKQ